MPEKAVLQVLESVQAALAHLVLKVDLEVQSTNQLSLLVDTLIMILKDITSNDCLETPGETGNGGTI